MSVKNKKYTLGDVFGHSSDFLSKSKGTPEDVVKNIFDEVYPDLELTHDQAKNLGRVVFNLKHGGSAGVGLICKGDECQLRHACVLWNEKTDEGIEIKDRVTGKTLLKQSTLAPKDKPCPLEAMVIANARDRYIEEFKDIRVAEIVLEGYINDLCQIAMLEWRCLMLLSKDHHGVLTKVPGAVTADGNVIYKKELSPVVDYLDRLTSRKTKILTDLVKTPREIYKKQQALGKKETDSASQVYARLRKELERKHGTDLPGAMRAPTDAEIQKKLEMPEDEY